jgi:hypothetical protein
MLDPDAYRLSEGEGGSSTTPIGHAGKTSTGSAGRPTSNGGATTTPIGGTGSGAASGVDVSRITATCEQYCPNYGTQCKKRLKGRECLPTCQGELTEFGPVCRELGLSAIQCLTPFFSATGGNCDEAVNRALAKCGKLAQAFDDCKAVFSKGAKSSGGTPATLLASCQRASGPSPSGDCSEIFQCPSGPLVTFCNTSNQVGFVDCGCIPPSGNPGMARMAVTSDPCLSASNLCP